MKTNLVAMACAVVLGLAAGGTAAAPSDQNILMIWIDDLGSQRLDLPEAKLPNLDALAARGVTFSRAYAPSPVCGGSRGAVMSGIPAHISRNGGNAKKAKFRTIKPYKNVVTWPQHLKEEHGRVTYATGKNFHAGPDPLSFDFMGPRTGGAERRGRAIERSKTGFHTSFSTQAPEATNDFKTAAYGANVVSQTHDQPFFLTVGIRRPHNPFFVPEEFNLWDLSEIGVTPGYQENDLNDTFNRFAKFRSRVTLDRQRGNIPSMIRGYLAAAAFADAAAGVVLDALAAGPNANNTIVVVAGDHGFCLGEKDHFTKAVMWDCASRTELIISAPGGQQGVIVDETVSLMDMQPTLLDLLELPARDDVFGQSLKSLVNGTGEAFDGFAVATYGRKNHALRARDYSYIRYINGKEEFYNLANDPWEHTNLLRQEGTPEGYLMMSMGLDNLLAGADRPF